MSLFSFNKKPAGPSADRMLLDTIVDSLLDAVIAFDEQFTMVVFNKSAELLFGLQAAEVLGKRFDVASMQQSAGG